VLQQWTGVNTVLFYGSVILKEQVGGHSQSAAIGANVFIGLVNCLSTIVALWLIDKLGRRPLLMYSAGGMVIAHGGLAFAFLQSPPNAILVMALMILCTASFAVGLGPGVWVVLSEIFPTRIRGRAMSIATVALWVAWRDSHLYLLVDCIGVGTNGRIPDLWGHVRVDHLGGGKIHSGDQGAHAGGNRKGVAAVGAQAAGGPDQRLLSRRRSPTYSRQKALPSSFPVPCPNCGRCRAIRSVDSSRQRAAAA
ncbi:MAG: MFS transporter, partial [Paludibaculum sp.]